MKPYLPLEIITNILLRLSPQNIATCKCVCKPWLNLIESDAFVESHLVKSGLALAVSIAKLDSNWFSVFKLEDELEPFSNWFDVFAKHGPITKFDFRRESTTIQSCVNAGSSWRAVEAAPPFPSYCESSICGAFFSGNLHWLVKSRTGIPDVCCFDLETERFSAFSAPLAEIPFTIGETSYSLDATGGSLEKCWTMVRLMHDHSYDYGYKRGCWQPIRIYRNGGVLMLSPRHKRFLYYSMEKRCVVGIDLAGEIDHDCLYFNSVLFTPSFLSLKRNLGMENARSLKRNLGIRM
ncbi:F-box protein-like protein [Salvia divinorum]|uniref:F-box protein-like protein n=1 Tax=Salvia divinorum TaxID=28513 RepID=A0ABD1HMI1_SALDI